jgi:HEAT repeat protein
MMNRTTHRLTPRFHPARLHDETGHPERASSRPQITPAAWGQIVPARGRTLRLLGGILLSVAAAVQVPCNVFAANADPQKTRELITVLQSNAGLHERARACQQLAILGTTEAIPPLAALLTDERLGHYARDALQVMPDPAAGDALREALGQLEGTLLIGVVNSLGLRRDTKAIAALSKLAVDRSSVAAPAALLALGRIGTPEALRLVQQGLTAGSAEVRAAAAEACLLVADQNLDQGRRDAAITLYDSVRKAAPEGQLRVTATHGAIVARQGGGLALLIEHLHSPDVAMRNVALRAIRELPGPLVTPAIVSELANANPPLQALIIAALVERGDRGALAAIEAKAAADDEEVRVAALNALGRIGASSSVPILLKAVIAGRTPAAAGAAVASLGRIAAPDTDAAILAALPPAPPAVRSRLIAVLGDRKAESAIPELIRLAQDGNAEIVRTAFRALTLIARPGDLPALVRLSVSTSDDATRTLADRAVVTTSMKVLEPARRADAVLAAFRQADDANTRAALLRPLGAVVRSMSATFDPFIAVRSALDDPAPVLRDAAIRCLADWPDATPSTTLLELVKRGLEPAQRDLAWQGAMRMAANVAAGRDRSPLNPVAFFAQANPLVRTPREKMALVSSLGNVKHIAAFNLLQPYLDDPAVATEAALAIVQIAPSLLNTKEGHAVEAVLGKIATSEKDEDTRRKAARAAKGLPSQPAGKQKGGGAAVAAGNRPPPKLPPGALFNGVDLSGWEGDPGVWRVRDGVIVGGTLEGNPRNEFLATTKPYRNFVLRLEYKLVGTEGFVNSGVQFRSVRVEQPPNEMSGYQADIGAGHSGSLYDETRRRKFLARAPAGQVARLEKEGDWNQYEIRCEGPRIELKLNGEKTLSYVEPDASIAQQNGVVALQIHGKCKAEIEFRNIVIEEL